MKPTTNSVQRIEHEKIPSGRDNAFEERHESFGAAALTLTTGGIKLFGSAVRISPNFVTLRITGARRCVDEKLLDEHILQDNSRPVTEIYFTRYQWAELVSSFNGVPVPCTLRTVGGVGMDPVPDEVLTPIEQIESSAQKQVKLDGEDAFRKAVSELMEAVASSGLSKVKAEKLSYQVRNLLQFIDRPKNAASWAATMLAEKTEQFVTSAKMEIAAAVDRTIHVAGIKALNGGALQLPKGERKPFHCPFEDGLCPDCRTPLKLVPSGWVCDEGHGF